MPASIDHNVNAKTGNTWYKSDYNMTSSCLATLSCDPIGPIWMNAATIPDQDDGIIDRIGCLRSWDSCCSYQYNLRVKNCNYFTVYCFLELLSCCPQRYCFETDLNKINSNQLTTNHY